MNNQVHTTAEALIAEFRACGKAVYCIEYSQNRYQQTSVYFSVIDHGRIRVSDHACNQDYRVNERSVLVSECNPVNVAATVARMIAGDAKATVQHGLTNLVEIAQRNEAEAEHKARFLGLPANSQAQMDTVYDLYPHARANKRLRREILARWRNA